MPEPALKVGSLSDDKLVSTPPSVEFMLFGETLRKTTNVEAGNFSLQGI